MSDIAQQAQGKWRGILGRFGVDDKTLSGKHTECPMCGGKDRFRFTDYGGRGAYICSPDGNGCGTGDGFDLLMKINGWEFKEAAAEVEKLVGTIKPAEKRQEKDPAIRLRKIASGAQRLTGQDPASAYLRNRGLQVMAPGLRFSAAVDYFDQGKRIGSYAAMLGPVLSPHGTPVTWHVTYLQAGRKADVSAPKKIMKAKGNINGGAIRLFPATDRVGIAEGIETAIAAHEIAGMPVWAVLNTSGMKSFVPPDGIKSVIIFADNDANYAGQLAAYEAAHRLSLAGVEVKVRIPSKTGEDWLDELNANPFREQAG